MGANIQVVATVVGSVVLALAGLVVVRRLVPYDALTDHTAVAGAVYAALAVVYGVILGQLVIAAWDDFEDARSAAIAEAASMYDLIRLAEAFPEPPRGELQRTALAYGRAVVDREWAAMARREAPDPVAAAAMDELYARYARLAAEPIGSLAPYAASLDELDELGDARGERLLASVRGLPGLMWVVLIAGGAVTVGFSYLFAVENRLAHAVMVAALAATVALLLALVAALDSPFRDPIGIPPDGFARVLERAGEVVSAAPATAATPVTGQEAGPVSVGHLP